MKPKNKIIRIIFLIICATASDSIAQSQLPKDLDFVLKKPEYYNKIITEFEPDLKFPLNKALLLAYSNAGKSNNEINNTILEILGMDDKPSKKKKLSR